MELKQAAVLITTTLFLISVGGQAKAQNRENEQATLTAEQYVLQQIQAGNPAKMADVFEEKDLVISAKFLKMLLTDSQHLQLHPHGIMIEGAIIEGELDLINNEIPYDTFLTGCHFLNPVNLTQSRFAKSLHLTDSVFSDDSDFDSATVIFDFNAEGARFETEAYFQNMRVEGDMLINRIDFESEANFTGTHVNGNLIADHAKFKNTADFDNLTVKGDATFRSDNFAGYVSFSEARLNNFFLTDSVLSGAQTDFTRMKMENGFLEGITYNKVRIDNMTFQYLSPESWDELQKLASHSAYNAEFYSALEALFQRHGYSDQADEVFIAHKRRDQQERLHGIEWFGNLMADILVGYGRRLEKLLLWSGIFVVVGYFVFRDEKGMETLKPDDKVRYANKYQAFWYSLDLFLTILCLGDKTIWTPRSDRRFAILYKRFHIIFGYVFVPIGLAALSGIIK